MHVILGSCSYLEYIYILRDVVCKMTEAMIIKSKLAKTIQIFKNKITKLVYKTHVLKLIFGELNGNVCRFSSSFYEKYSLSHV